MRFLICSIKCIETEMNGKLHQQTFNFLYFILLRFLLQNETCYTLKYNLLDYL